MPIDPDSEGGPDPDWYRAELDACRARIAELEARLTEAIARLPHSAYVTLSWVRASEARP